MLALVSEAIQPYSSYVSNTCLFLLRPQKKEKGKMRVHHLNNVNNALQILRDYRIKLVNINNNDIVDGNPKLTLGLVWSIILHWQVSQRRSIILH